VRRLAIALPLAVGALAYANTVANGYVLDDYHLIVENPAVQRLDLGALFAHATVTAGGAFYRPLGLLSFAVDHALFGMRPAWMHLMSLVYHLLAVAAVFDFARRLGGVRLALATALLFAAHPVHTEAVSALANRPEAMATALYVALLSIELSRWRTRRWQVVVENVVLLAALLCKETAVATALALPWLARVPPGGSRRPWLVSTLVLTAAWAVAYLMVRRSVALALPHGLEAHLSPRLLLEPARYAWAIAGTLRALVSLPMLAAPREGIVLAGVILVLGAALVQFATSPVARARFARQRGWAMAGLAWFVLASGTLLSVYPVWSPERVVYASLGLG